MYPTFKQFYEDVANPVQAKKRQQASKGFDSIFPKIEIQTHDEPQEYEDDNDKYNVEVDIHFKKDGFKVEDRYYAAFLDKFVRYYVKVKPVYTEKDKTTIHFDFLFDDPSKGKQVIQKAYNAFYNDEHSEAMAGVE